ncbi:hybrid sensor histidine kinase/response regulator transcription factor [Crocinitomix catalasitica]|uniref:hybrid sensor histidine kinase/response regulator transcription factor n=1 Tax=Crocinitomix catalasitica TaxID=184607 RepID=UPI000A5E00C0|nr:ATP-binding protein [Crocinitomix catalasitica]
MNTNVLAFGQAQHDFKEDSTAIIKLFDNAIANPSKIDSLKTIAESKIVGRENLAPIYFYHLAKFYYLTQSLDKSAATVQQGLDGFDVDAKDPILIQFYSLKGAVLGYKNDNLGAIQAYKKALELADNEGNLERVALMNNNIANIFFSSRDYESAYKHSSKAYDLLKNTDNPYLASITAVSAISAIKVKRLKEGKFLADESIRLSELTNDQLGFMIGYFSLGEYYLLTNQLDQAIENIHKSLVLSEQYYQKPYILIAKTSLLNAYVAQGDFINAIKYGEEALAGSIEQGTDDTKYSIYKNLAYAYAGNDQKIKAYDYLVKAHEAFLVTNDHENKEIINDLLIKYDADKKAQEIELLTAKNKIIEHEKRIQFYFIIAGVILFILIGLLVYVIIRSRKKVTDKLIELDIQKTKFFENISHEFRTPLTLIKLPIVDSVSDGTSLSKESKELILENTNRLQSLIDDLMTIAKLEMENIKENKTIQDPVVQIVSIANEFENLANSKGIKIERKITDTGIYALYDRNSMYKIISNLISNAIKFSPIDHKVFISSGWKEKHFTFIIEDQGRGLSPIDQSKIFDRFYQVNSNDNNVNGTGIGLTLVKELIHLNGGNIIVESAIEKGAKFIVTLPLNISEATSVTNDVETTLTQKLERTEIEEELAIINADKPQVLIVEDNPDLLKYLHAEFKDDFKVYTALNGEEGLKLAVEHIPDIIISDWMMPKLSGIDFCHAVKNNNLTNHIPFVLLTAKGDVQNKIQGYSTGADAYFSKPFNTLEIKAHVNNLIQTRQKLFEKFKDANNEIQDRANITSPQDIEFWNSFINEINNRIGEPTLSATELANALFISRMQLHRKIKGITGKTVGVILNEQRMKLAKKLLKQKDCRIIEVADATGFSNSSAFSRAFKKEFNLTPTEFMNK